MLIENAIKNKDWKFDEVSKEWIHTTLFFSKDRNGFRKHNVRYIIVNCAICGILILQKKYRQEKAERAYCSGVCRGKALKKFYSGKNHIAYKSGKSISNGYIRVLCPDHHRATSNGYVMEHILIAEKKYGRKILIDEDVHHIDECHSNNDPVNLEVLSRKEHCAKHKKNKYKISDEYLEHAILVEKKTFGSIAKDIGCSISLIRRKCLDIGLQSPYVKYKITNGYLKKAILEDKRTLTSIANEIGCSVALISIECKKRCIKSSYRRGNKSKVKRRFLRRA